MSQPTRLIIVDDDAQVRRSVRMRLQLEPSIEVVGESADGPTAVLMASRLNPDVVLLDLNLPGESGLEVCRTLTQVDISVVMFSLDDADQTQKLCLACGATLFVSKRAPVRDLVRALVEAHGRDWHALTE